MAYALAVRRVWSATRGAVASAPRVRSRATDSASICARICTTVEPAASAAPTPVMRVTATGAAMPTAIALHSAAAAMRGSDAMREPDCPRALESAPMSRTIRPTAVHAARSAVLRRPAHSDIAPAWDHINMIKCKCAAGNVFTATNACATRASGSSPIHSSAAHRARATSATGSAPILSATPPTAERAGSPAVRAAAMPGPVSARPAHFCAAAVAWTRNPIQATAAVAESPARAASASRAHASAMAKRRAVMRVFALV